MLGRNRIVAKRTCYVCNMLQTIVSPSDIVIHTKQESLYGKIYFWCDVIW